MAEPKKRLTRTRSGNRQSHDALRGVSLVPCSNCKTRGIPHRVCSNCGYYKGKQVVLDKSQLKEESKKKEELKDE